MIAMFVEGTAFWIKGERPAHLWIVISDPRQDEEQIVIVNFTTLDESAGPHDPYNDRSCLIQAGEHPFVQKLTCVDYGGVQITRTSHLQNRYERGELRLDIPVSPELLARIRKGAEESEHLLPLAHDILRAQGLV